MPTPAFAWGRLYVGMTMKERPLPRGALFSQQILRLVETEHTEKDRPVRVQPVGRCRTDPARDDRAIERSELVEAHQRGNLQAGLSRRADGCHVGAAALN